MSATRSVASTPSCIHRHRRVACLQWFAAVYTGLVAAAYACLLINGFVGFQFAEDGTPLSLWVRLYPSFPFLSPNPDGPSPFSSSASHVPSFLALPSLLPSPPLKILPASATRSLLVYGSFTSCGHSSASLFTSSLNSSSSSARWKTGGPSATLCSVLPFSLSDKSCYLRLA